MEGSCLRLRMLPAGKSENNITYRKLPAKRGLLSDWVALFGSGGRFDGSTINSNRSCPVSSHSAKRRCPVLPPPSSQCSVRGAPAVKGNSWFVQWCPENRLPYCIPIGDWPIFVPWLYSDCIYSRMIFLQRVLPLLQQAPDAGRAAVCEPYDAVRSQKKSMYVR